MKIYIVTEIIYDGYEIENIVHHAFKSRETARAYLDENNFIGQEIFCKELIEYKTREDYEKEWKYLRDLDYGNGKLPVKSKKTIDAYITECELCD